MIVGPVIGSTFPGLDCMGVGPCPDGNACFDDCQRMRYINGGICIPKVNQCCCRE